MEYNDSDAHAWIDTVASPTRRRDALTLLEIMKRVSGEEPRMWGPSIIGFGRYHYKYESGVEGDAGAAGFSPRKAAMTVSFSRRNSHLRPATRAARPAQDRRRLPVSHRFQKD